MLAAIVLLATPQLSAPAPILSWLSNGANPNLVLYDRQSQAGVMAMSKLYSFSIKTGTIDQGEAVMLGGNPLEAITTSQTANGIATVHPSGGKADMTTLLDTAAGGKTALVNMTLSTGESVVARINLDARGNHPNNTWLLPKGHQVVGGKLAGKVAFAFATDGTSLTTYSLEDGAIKRATAVRIRTPIRGSHSFDPSSGTVVSFANNKVILTSLGGNQSSFPMKNDVYFSAGNRVFAIDGTKWFELNRKAKSWKQLASPAPAGISTDRQRLLFLDANAKRLVERKLP